MGIDAVTFGGSATQAAPRMVADLRPSADAAALARDPRAAAASAMLPVATQPAALSQTAEVSRSMIGQQVGAITEPQRVLKPWGVAMLPADPAPQQGTGERTAGDRRDTAETPAGARETSGVDRPAAGRKAGESTGAEDRRDSAGDDETSRHPPP